MSRCGCAVTGESGTAPGGNRASAAAAAAGVEVGVAVAVAAVGLGGGEAVSYTHLTLPTRFAV